MLAATAPAEPEAWATLNARVPSSFTSGHPFREKTHDRLPENGMDLGHRIASSAAARSANTKSATAASRRVDRLMLRRRLQSGRHHARVAFPAVELFRVGHRLARQSRWPARRRTSVPAFCDASRKKSDARAKSRPASKSNASCDATSPDLSPCSGERAPRRAPGSAPLFASASARHKAHSDRERGRSCTRA